MTDVSEELSVTVNSPDELVWEGKATSVSSENSAGKFDVLPEHANFVTMIKEKPIIIRSQRAQDRVLTYKSAVLSVREGRVTIYADI